MHDRLDVLNLYSRIDALGWGIPVLQDSSLSSVEYLEITGLMYLSDRFAEFSLRTKGDP